MSEPVWKPEVVDSTEDRSFNDRPALPDTMDIVTRATTRVATFGPGQPARVLRVRCAHRYEPDGRLCHRWAVMEDGMCAHHSALHEQVTEVKRRARQLLEQNAMRYAELHLDAAEVAARDGNSKPALEGLLHSRAIEPVKTQADGPGGVVVQVGVMLPGLGQPPTE
jgi:hypothetical protein